MKLPTLEMGDIHLLLVDGWTGGWEVLRGTVFGAQISVVKREIVDHALHRLSRPLVEALGIPPEGALRKIPPVSRRCRMRRKNDEVPYKCPLYDKNNCFPTAKAMPWCFEPDGVENQEVRKKAVEAIELWREGVYVVVVLED